MLQAELTRLYPRLFHVAEAGAWPEISKRGLLTTTQLCDLFEVLPEARIELLQQRRPAKVVMEHATHGKVVLRDQGPLSTKKLANCLEAGMTVEEWLLGLNDRVFFWLQENRLFRMLDAYADQEHDVLTVDTARLLARHADRTRLSRINSGSTAYLARPRGAETFKRIEQYEHPPRRRAAAAAGDVAELAVLGGVPDVQDFTVSVWRYGGRKRLRAIFEA